MILALAVESTVWYGPASVTFQVQFPGDPLDATRNDVRVRFLGDKSQREERAAYFDANLGAWRAVLYAKEAGSYRAVLVRNGVESEIEAKEGIIELKRTDAGVLPAKAAREDRWAFDTGDPWIGFGADLGSTPTASEVIELANAGANWVRIALPSGDPTDEWNEAIDTIERRGLSYTLALPESCSSGCRRYAATRFGASPRLVQWDGDVDDPWKRPSSTASGWEDIFENRPGPFMVPVNQPARVKAFKALLDAADWSDWPMPKVWHGGGMKGVAERDRMIILAPSGSKLAGLPLADGVYEVTSIDPATGANQKSEGKVEHAAVTLSIPAERFVVLRRR